MLRFKEYTDIENYIESLLEYTIANHPTGSYVTWGISNGKPNIAGWITTGFSNTAIPLSDTTVFQLVDGKPEDFEDNYIIGTSKEAKDIIAYTDVYDDIEGKLLGKVAWTKNPEGSWKGLESGTDIKWGSNTDAVETAACMGVYLDADGVLADEKKLGPAKTREKWTPEIKKVLNGSHDWDSGGVTKLVSKMDDMSDVNWRTMILIAKGMQNFISQEGKNIGSTYHIIHGSIRDYYAAEENNPAIETTGDAKTNTADMILANVSAEKVIKAMTDQVVKYDETNYYCYTGENKSIKFYQISLKKSMDGAQLGKLTSAVKALYKVGQDSTTLWKSIVNSYMVNHGYGVSQLDEGWFSDKLSQGLTAIKSFATTWYKKIVGLFNKIKEIGKALVSGYDKNLPSGRPNNFQKSLITSIFNESKNLSHGEFLTEAKAQTEKSINDYLRNATSEEAVLLLEHVNGQLKTIEDYFKTQKHLVNKSVKGKVGTGVYKTTNGKNSWTDNDMYKLYANASALEAFIAIYELKKGDVTSLKSQMVNLEREIYFGKTQLPVFKVYGAKNDGDKATTTRLGTSKEFTSTRNTKITGAGFDWPVMGIRYSNQGKFYTIEGTLLSDADETTNEPTYTACRMGTNQSKAYSFIIEGTAVKTYDQFKNTFY
jgi:hypothetical protein